MSKYIILNGTDSNIKGKADTLLDAVKIQGAEKGSFKARIYKLIDFEVAETDLEAES